MKCKDCIHYKKEMREGFFNSKQKEMAWGCSFPKGYKNVRRKNGKCIEFVRKIGGGV